METDLEYPQYLERKWESAVATIIATIDNSTSADVAAPDSSTADETATAATAARSPAAVPVSKSVAGNSPIIPGHHIADAVGGVASPAGPVKGGGQPSAPKIPLPAGPSHQPIPASSPTAPSITVVPVVPVVVPYLLPAGVIPGPASSSPLHPSSPPNGTINSTRPVGCLF